MITTDEGFRQTLEQLQRAYEALAVLRQQVKPISLPWFDLMAEGPVDQIRQLQQEIEAYLQIPRIDVASDKTPTETVEGHTGFLREIDLDNLSFILRNTDDVREIHCAFEDDLLATAKEGLDRQVKVTGVRKHLAGRRPVAVLRVMRLEIIEE